MALQSRSLTRDARRETRAKTMNFKLPHDVVFTCAKRDEPPSRRRPTESSALKIHLLPTPLQNYGRCLRGIPFLPCIQWTTQKIRVYSCAFVVIPSEYNGKCRSLADFRIHSNASAMVIDDGFHQRQTKAVAAGGG